MNTTIDREQFKWMNAYPGSEVIDCLDRPACPSIKQSSHSSDDVTAWFRWCSRGQSPGPPFCIDYAHGVRVYQSIPRRSGWGLGWYWTLVTSSVEIFYIFATMGCPSALALASRCAGKCPIDRKKWKKWSVQSDRGIKMVFLWTIMTTSWISW